MRQQFDLLAAADSYGEGRLPFLVLRVFKEGYLRGVYVGELVESCLLEVLIGCEVPLGADQWQDLCSRLHELSLLALVYDVKFKDGMDGVVFIEVVRPRVRLFVIGAGHVGQALARIGSVVGYNVILADDRDEFLELGRSSVPGVDTIKMDFDYGVSIPDFDDNVALVIVTRGHQFDEWFLRRVLEMRRRPRYIGMIGSRRRVGMIKKRLENDGFERRDLDGLHAPIGLAIGAVTPQEIAVAIVAEIINKFRCGDKEEM
jgi:xanthine/CO dehydrogenase XdhC/CoxF family maturation factor